MLVFLTKEKIKLFVVTYFVLAVVAIISFDVSAKIVTLQNLVVIKIIDGDTIWVQNNNKLKYKVRLLGINAPEISTSPPEPFAFSAKQKLTDLLKNQKIYIEYNSKEKTDKYNRVLAQVYRKKDNLWINAELIKSGLAYVYILSPDISKLEQLIKTENIAISNKVNIWNNKNYATIKPQDAKKFLGHYKVIIGTISDIKFSKKNIWLEFKSNNNTISINNLTQTPESDYIFSAFTLKSLYNKGLDQSFVFAVKILKNKPLANNNWKKLLGKTVKIRGYIEQYNKKFPPFVNLINLQSIEVLKTNEKVMEINN